MRVRDDPPLVSLGRGDGVGSKYCLLTILGKLLCKRRVDIGLNAG